MNDTEDWSTSSVLDNFERVKQPSRDFPNPCCLEEISRKVNANFIVGKKSPFQSPPSIFFLSVNQTLL
jgi:hypothetical protein